MTPAGRVAKAVIQSDTTVFFTPVTFGGYSPDLKKMMDRFIQLISPYFQMEHGEVHHPPRYARRPRLLMVGVQRQPNPHEAHIFKTLAGRNAINFHPPSVCNGGGCCYGPCRHAPPALGSIAGQVGCSALRPGRRFADAATCGLRRGHQPASPRRALLIVGSPKTNSPSTSSILGSYLLAAPGRPRLGNRIADAPGEPEP